MPCAEQCGGGGVDWFGRVAPTDTRWRVMLESGCRVGQEYKQAWDLLKHEAEQGSEYLL